MATRGPIMIEHYLGDDARFRAWAQAIHDHIAATGMVQTADTGQINLATVTRPTAINTVAGFEIWRFDDALQATAPMFFKAEYGIGLTLDRPMLSTSVATGTNGAGTLTGQVSTRSTGGASTVRTSGATQPQYSAGNKSRLHLVHNFDTLGGAGHMIIVERTKDAAGNETADGIVFISVTSSGGAVQVIPFTGAVPPNATSIPVLDPNKYVASNRGGDIGLWHVFFFLGKPVYTNLLAGANPTDLPAQSTFVAPMFGVNHTFLSLAGMFAAGSGAIASSFTAAPAICLLWE